MFHSACSASWKPAASSDPGGSVDSPAIIASMRLISAVWSATTSEVNPKSTESLRRAGLAQQVLDHGDGAAVVLDHQLEEEP